MTPSFTIREKGPVIYFELDTPGSSVNVFTREAAIQLSEELGKLNRNRFKFIVFLSRKPYSFINGTQLSLAPSMKGFCDIAKLAGPTKDAYEIVEKEPLITIAAVEGSCFGCGVEFSLCCDYRVASDSSETRFYMTELIDYLFPPFLGGLQKLPRLLGFESAFEFITEGKVLYSQAALKTGLVDQVIRIEHFETDLERFIDGLDKRKPDFWQYLPVKDSRQDLDLLMESAKERINNLPFYRHHLHLGVLDIIYRNLNGSSTFDAMGQSIADLFDSLSIETWQNAARFFFFQTMARTASLKTSSLLPQEYIVIHLPENPDSTINNLLADLKLRNLTIDRSIDQSNLIGPMDFGLGSAETEKFHPFTIKAGYQDWTHQEGRNYLYFPLDQQKGLCEVFITDALAEPLTSFFQILFHLGWETIVTRSHQNSVLNEFIKVYTDFVKRFLRNIEDFRKLINGLRTFGFERSPLDILKQVGADIPADYYVVLPIEVTSPETIMSLLQLLHQTGLNLLEEKRLQHSTQVDVMVKVLFGFPISKGGFSHYVHEAYGL